MLSFQMRLWEMPLFTRLSSLAHVAKEIYKVVTFNYRVYPALSEELKQSAFQIRHKVYCEELGYEQANSTKMEKDVFDQNATQLVLFSKDVQKYVGCLRLVHVNPQDKDELLPFERLCAGTLNHALVKEIKDSGEKYAEISRLSLIREFRKASEDSKGVRRRRKSSLGAPILYLGLVSFMIHRNIRYIFAIVEPRLFRGLQRLGIPIRQIGEGIEHRGLRIPIVIDTIELEKTMIFLARPVYYFVKLFMGKDLGAMSEKKA